VITQRPHIGARQNNRTRTRIRNVIMRAGPVIDRILAAASRPALKAVKLGDHLRLFNNGSASR